MAKWTIELGDHTIEYQAPSAKKAQVLADFLAEYPGNTEPQKDKDEQASSKALKDISPTSQVLTLTTEVAGLDIQKSREIDPVAEWIIAEKESPSLPPPPEGEPPVTALKHKPTLRVAFIPKELGPEEKDIWELYVDGSSAAHAGGTGLLLISPERAQMEYAIRLTFPVTNNEAEYEALIAGMKMAKSVMAKKLKAYSDSQLVTEQYSGKFTTKSASMIKYLKVVKELEKAFDMFSLIKINRAKNTIADGLSKWATVSGAVDTRTVVLMTANESTLTANEVIINMGVISDDNTWMSDIVNYLQNGI